MPDTALPHPHLPGDRLAAVITQRTHALAADLNQLRADADHLAAGLHRGWSTEDTARLTTLAQRIHAQAARIEGLQDARSLT